jgi:hypothetical protein
MFTQDYLPLPATGALITRCWIRHAASGSRNRRLLVTFTATVVALAFWWWQIRSRSRYVQADWTNIQDRERYLPQHNNYLLSPEEQGGRYVRFTAQTRGLGWNNVLSEM